MRWATPGVLQHQNPSVCDSQGTVVGIHVTPGQRHESKAFEPTLQRVYLRRGVADDDGHAGWPGQGLQLPATGVG